MLGLAHERDELAQLGAAGICVLHALPAMGDHEDVALVGHLLAEGAVVEVLPALEGAAGVGLRQDPGGLQELDVGL